MAGRQRTAQDFPTHLRFLESVLIEREQLRKAHDARITPRVRCSSAGSGREIFEIEARHAGASRPEDLPARKFSELLGRALVEIQLVRRYPGTIREMPLTGKGMDYRLDNGVGIEIKCTISEVRRRELRNGEVIEVPNWHVSPKQVDQEVQDGKPRQVYVFVSAVRPPLAEFWVLTGAEVARQLKMRDEVRRRLGRKSAPALVNRTLPPTYDDEEADTRAEWLKFYGCWNTIPGIGASRAAKV